MDLKDYREMPDSGLFEKIERRVVRRRVARMGGVVLAVALLAGAGVWMLTTNKVSEEQVAMENNVGSEVVMANGEMSTMDAEVQMLDSKVPAMAVKKEKEEGQVAGKVDNAEKTVSSSEQVAVQEERKTEEPIIVYQQTAVAPAVVPVVEPATEAVVTDVTPTEQRTISSPDTTRVENMLVAPNIIVLSDDVDPENRQFKVVANGEVSNFQMSIFNRAGRQVFSTNDINRAWDGRRNGTPVTQGTYVWVARFRDSQGKVHREKGSVTVIR